jgi:hypothetical protein
MSSAALATILCNHAPKACVEESLLHRVLRVLVRRRYRAGDCVGATLVQSHERGEGAPVAVLRREHEITLALSCASRRFSRRLQHGCDGMDLQCRKHLYPGKLSTTVRNAGVKR